MSHEREPSVRRASMTPGAAGMETDAPVEAVASEIHQAPACVTPGMERLHHVP